MSFFMYTQTCGDCKASWQCSFGIVGTSQIGSGSAKKCPKCGSENVGNGSQAMVAEQSKDGVEQSTQCYICKIENISVAEAFLHARVHKSSFGSGLGRVPFSSFRELALVMEAFAALRSQVPSSGVAARDAKELILSVINKHRLAHGTVRKVTPVTWAEVEEDARPVLYGIDLEEFVDAAFQRAAPTTETEKGTE